MQQKVSVYYIEAFPDDTTCEDRCQLSDAVLLLCAAKPLTACVTQRLLGQQLGHSFFIQSEIGITYSAACLYFTSKKDAIQHLP